MANRNTSARDPIPTRSRKPLFIIIGLSLVGVGLAIYASINTLFLQFQGLENPSACTANDWINCDVAQASSYALWFGLPSAWYGFVFYLWLAVTMTWAVLKPAARPVMVSFASLFSLVALLITLYKAAVLFLVLKVVCLVCVALYLVNIAIFLLLIKSLDFRWLSLLRRRRPTDGDETRMQSSYVWKYLLWGTLVAGVFVGGVKWAADKYLGLGKVDVGTEVGNHFLQTAGQIEVHPQAATWGNPEARVTVVEYSDFQCPFCRRAAFHLRGILWEYRDRIRLNFMNFPLDKKINPRYWNNKHDQAGLAALAAVCAQKHGEFWEFHDELFHHQDELSPEFILELAVRHGWSRDEFEAELKRPETRERVRQEIGYAIRAGVNSTPSLYINGRRVKFWSHPEILRKIIEEELRRAAQRS